MPQQHYWQQGIAQVAPAGFVVPSDNPSQYQEVTDHGT
jgi:hypothetical protein